MSDQWSQTKLGKVCEIILGQSPRSDTYNQEQNGLPFFQGKSEFTNKYAQVKTWCSDPLKIADKGDILVSVRAPVGESNIAPEDCCIGRGLAALRADQENLLQEFLWHQIGFKKVDLQAISQGSTFDAISGKNISELEVEIPPLPEQKKIADILSGIDEAINAITKKQKKIDLILSQAIIESTNPKDRCCWHESVIGEVIVFQGGAQPPRSTFKFFPQDGYIRMLQIRDYKSDARSTYIPLNLCKRFCDKEDVMIGRYGPPNFQILRGKQGSYNVALIKASPKDESVITKNYIYRFLQRRDLFLLMDALSQRTSGQQGLDMDALKQFPIFVPDIPTQRRICESIDAIETTSLNLKRRANSLRHLKSALSDQLLSGSKRVSV